MKPEHFPPKELPEVSDAFFSEQADHILKKTTEIEKWSLPGTRNIESSFPVPEGYWLSLEQGIRNRISSPARVAFPDFNLIPKPALAMVLSLLFFAGFAGMWFFQYRTKDNHWSAGLEQVSETELLAYVESRPGFEVQEITENMASGALSESDMVVPDLKISEQDIDENLESINEHELLQNYDNY